MPVLSAAEECRDARVRAEPRNEPHGRAGEHRRGGGGARAGGRRGGRAPVAAATLLVLVFASGHPALTAVRARFAGLMLMFAGAMLLTVTATTLAALLMGWEVMGAASYALIGFWRDVRARIEAATTAFLTTRAADLGLYLAAGAAVAAGVEGMRLVDLGDARDP